MYLFFAFSGTVVAHLTYKSPGDASRNPRLTGTELIALLYIALSFGFSLAVNVWIFFRVSGGLFNPAVFSSVHILYLPSNSN